VEREEKNGHQWPFANEGKKRKEKRIKNVINPRKRKKGRSFFNPVMRFLGRGKKGGCFTTERKKKKSLRA